MIIFKNRTAHIQNRTLTKLSPNNVRKKAHRLAVTFKYEGGKNSTTLSENLNKLCKASNKNSNLAIPKDKTLKLILNVEVRATNEKPQTNRKGCYSITT